MTMQGTCIAKVLESLVCYPINLQPPLASGQPERAEGW